MPGGVKAPAGAAHVDFTGKTIMPALIDAHVHLGYQVGLNFAAENFTRETLVDQLNRYAYAGVAAVLSLGTEPGRAAVPDSRRPGRRTRWAARCS